MNAEMNADESTQPQSQYPATPCPLLISAAKAGELCCRSRASWWRDHKAGRIPSPVYLNGRTLWRAEELRDWVNAGCPDRQTWEATAFTTLHSSSARGEEGDASLCTDAGIV